MLRIVVELVPGGNEPQKREIARATLSNITLSDVSDYLIDVRERANPVAGTDAWNARGTIHGHDRRQSVWRLVARAAVWAAWQQRRQS
jgi:hypothetical protein